MCKLFLTGENHTFVHSTDQKPRLHTSDFAYSNVTNVHFKQERRNWSPTFFNSPSPPVSTFLQTRTHTK